MSPRERIHRAVRRARARLDALRLLKAAARGALWGGGAGLAILLLSKAMPALPVAAWAAWSLLGAGVVAGVVAAAARPRIGLTAAALFLDDRLGTQQRVVTVLTQPEDAFTDRIVAELSTLRIRARFPFPREAGVVPAALFLLFAAGLLPEAGRRVEAAPGPEARRATAASLGEAGAFIDVTEAVKQLAEGKSPDAAEAKRLRDAIARGLHRPEERREANRALDQAVEGDGAAAKKLVAVLKALEGEARDGATASTAYPDEEAYLLAYRRELSREDK